MKRYGSLASVVIRYVLDVDFVVPQMISLPSRSEAPVRIVGSKILVSGTNNRFNFCNS